MHKTLNSRSKHIALHSLTEGIFAAISEDGGSAISSSGLIDLGGQILVFDTFLTPQVAMDLMRSATDIYGLTPQFVFRGTNLSQSTISSVL